jgi:hypothetical protein
MLEKEAPDFAEFIAEYVMRLLLDQDQETQGL